MKAAIEESAADEQNGEKEEEKPDLKRKGTMQETVEVSKSYSAKLLLESSKYRVVLYKLNIPCWFCLLMSHGNSMYDGMIFFCYQQSRSVQKHYLRNLPASNAR